MLPARNVVLEVGRDHSAVPWHTLLAGCLPLWAAEDPSAGGLRGASIKTALRLPVDLVGDHRGHTGRSCHVLLGMLGGERDGEGLIPVLAGFVQGPGSRCEVLWVGGWLLPGAALLFGLEATLVGSVVDVSVGFQVVAGSA